MSALTRGVGVFLAVLAWGNLQVAKAQAPATAANLALNEVVDLALRDNPQLQGLRSRWGAMQERPAQAGALPNPMFTYSGMDRVSGGTWPDTEEKRFMLQQEFLWFGKRGLRGSIAAKDAETMRREVDALTLDVIMQVKESYYDLYAVQRATAITREEQEVLGRMVKIAETLYATGERSQADVLKAQTEITLLKQKLLELQAQEAALKAKLNTLLNRRADAPLGVAATPPQTGFSGNFEQLLALAVTNRPEIRSAQTQIERYELDKQLMAKEYWPDYKLGVEYRDFTDSDNMLMFTVSVELPIWQSKYRAGAREAAKMAASSRAARETVERQTALDVQDTHVKFLTARKTLALYRTELIPQAETSFNASEAGYRTGKASFLDLLESERFLLNARVMAAMTEGALGMQAARLERAVGNALPPKPMTELLKVDP
ncbi:MAG: TolC family protein [Kiritimatiellia bacterium]|jgi:outer membrane protein TolC